MTPVVRRGKRSFRDSLNSLREPSQTPGLHDRSSTVSPRLFYPIDFWVLALGFKHLLIECIEASFCIRIREADIAATGAEDLGDVGAAAADFALAEGDSAVYGRLKSARTKNLLQHVRHPRTWPMVCSFVFNRLCMPTIRFEIHSTHGEA